MTRLSRRLSLGLFLVAASAGNAWAQKTLTWQEIREKFEAANPSLRAGQLGVDESRAQEITAYLRPNPNLAVSTDGIQR
jgi:cobalt-zinc-cadmium efflux system outer membrane protein